MTTRYLHTMGPQEALYYSLLLSEPVREGADWKGWLGRFAPLLDTVFPWSLVRPGDTAVQVGANGPFLRYPGASQPLILASRVGPTGRVMLLEADPTSVATLAQVTGELGLSWVEAVQIAVSDHAGEITGAVVDGHYYFWDPAAEGAAGATSSRQACAELKLLWDDLERRGTRQTCACDRLDVILPSRGVAPAFVNLTINGYEPTAIRGLGALLDGDLVIALPARAPEPIFDDGLLEALEAHGYRWVLSNTPHGSMYPWFPYLTAVRPHRLAEIKPLVEGAFTIDPDRQMIAFVDPAGARRF